MRRPNRTQIIHSCPDAGRQVRISAKNLGALALPDCCPRCFWLKLKSGFKLPWQIFPGIFSSIDGFTKRVIHAWFDQHNSAPPWLTSLGDVTGYVEPPHYTRFNFVDEQHDILLTGVPDGILVRPDGSRIIIDYKTARYTAHQDTLLPMYQIQLNVYAQIAQACKLGPVSDLVLLYMEPQTDASEKSPDCCRGYGFDMPFAARVLTIDRDPGLIQPLLARVRELSDLKSPPPAAEECRDCALLSSIIDLSGS